MVSSNSTRSFLPDPSADHGGVASRIAPVWDGILHEFRNHLTVLMAATSELRAEMPPALALQVGDAMCETERNVQGLTSLVAIVDASRRTAEPMISTLGEVVDRAIRLAAPAVGRRATVTTAVPRETGVRNRGTALECLLAILIADLAWATGGWGSETERSPRVRVEADASRRGLAIEVSCEGAHPDPTSWRFLLALDLAAKLDATLVSQPEVAAYVIQLR
jgi:hypothetical protein